MCDEKPVGLILKEFDKKLVQCINIKLKEEGVTLSQLAVLDSILKNENITLKDIESKYNLQRPTVIGILKRLEAKGFVEYIPSEKDKRCRIIRATEKSEKMRDNMEIKKRQMDNLILDGMTEEEIKIFRNLLERALENVSKEADKYNE